MSLKTFFFSVAANNLLLGKEMEYGGRFSTLKKHIFNRSVLADVECLVEGHVFKAHRFPLSCFSPYLKRRLQNADGKPLSSKVRIKNIECSAFGVLLRYMYTGKLDLNCNNFLDVYKGAFLLEMPDVQKECLQRIDGKDEIRTYFYSYVLFKKFGRHQDCERQLELITHRFEETALSKEFMELDVNYAVEILSAETIGARSEIIVFLAALNWLNYNFGHRHIFTENVMECVRFSSMTMEEIVACYHPPFLPQVVQNPQVMMLLFKATCFVAAKSQGQESCFKQYASPSRVLTVEGLPLTLWHKRRETQPFSSNYGLGQVSTAQKEYSRLSQWGTRENVVKDVKNVVTAIEGNGDDDTLDIDILTESLYYNSDLDLNIAPKIDMKDFYATDDGLDLSFPLPPHVEHARHGSSVGRTTKTYKKVADFLQSIVKIMSGNTGEENSCIRKKWQESAYSEEEKYNTSLIEGSRCSPSIAEDFIIPTSHTDTDLHLTLKSNSGFESKDESFVEKKEDKISEKIGFESSLEAKPPTTEEKERFETEDEKPRTDDDTEPLVQENRKTGVSSKGIADSPKIQNENYEATERTLLNKVEEGALLVVGGMNPKHFEKDMGSVVSVYDKKSSDWLPYITLPKPRHNHSAAVMNNCLYVVGGCNSKDTVEKNKHIARRTCFKLHLSNKKWMTMSSTKCSRFDHGMVAYNGLLYVFGGQGEDDRILKSLETYDPLHNRWTLSNSSMCCGRKAMGIAVFEDRIWIAGGLVEDGNGNQLRAMSLVDCYSPTEKRWYFNTYSLPGPRCFCSLAVWDQKLFCIAGMASEDGKSGPTDEVWYVENESEPWKKAPSLPKPKIGGVAITYDDKLYFLGGFDPEDDVSKIFMLTRGSALWKMGPALKSHLFGLSAVYIFDKTKNYSS